LAQYSLSHFLCTTSSHVCYNLPDLALENGTKRKEKTGGEMRNYKFYICTVNCPIALRCASNLSSIS